MSYYVILVEHHTSESMFFVVVNRGVHHQPFGLKISSVFNTNTKLSNLNTGLLQISLYCELLSDVNIRVLRGLEGLLEDLKLTSRESRPLSTVLPRNT